VLKYFVLEVKGRISSQGEKCADVMMVMLLIAANLSGPTLDRRRGLGIKRHIICVVLPPMDHNNLST
jgi:hypothetical protein